MDKKSWAYILIIGDEILLGQRQDTNSHYLASELTKIGVTVKRIIAVGDDKSEIQNALQDAQNNSGAAIITGGLGPTQDDITRPAVADFFGAQLLFNPTLSEIIEKKYRARGIKIPECVKVQAEFPQGAQPIDNQFGTAPGIFFRQGDFLCFVIPGVPTEMKGMAEKFIFPLLIDENRVRPFLYRVFRTAGVSEAILSERIGDWEMEGIKLAYLPKYFGVDLRISTEAESIETANALLDQAEERIVSQIGDVIYGQGDIELAEVIGEILTANNWRLTIAESCTGGLLGAMITDIPGASRYFRRGFITYSNQAKSDMLGVPEGLIEKHGAVSAQVAGKMAEGAANWAKADFALSITGIAGPTGGAPPKPVGTTYIAIAHPEGLDISKFSFQDNRNLNRLQSARAALLLLHTTLKKYIS
ncbi:MAG: competence/damage-inducible protein A [candidate division Zixibacteria bacterium]|nr:competence/damage-inducible protein A [Candidatus Tariuqbacter arcticus]